MIRESPDTLRLIAHIGRHPRASPVGGGPTVEDIYDLTMRLWPRLDNSVLGPERIVIEPVEASVEWSRERAPSTPRPERAHKRRLLNAARRAAEELAQLNKGEPLYLRETWREDLHADQLLRRQLQDRMDALRERQLPPFVDHDTIVKAG